MTDTATTSEPTDVALQRHLLLVGLPGAGKTSVGRRLAKDLQRPFADIDEQVELHVGYAIPRIFTEHGEESFRRWECEVLASLLGRDLPLVVASGGGTVTTPENQRIAAERSVVVWLRAAPAFLVGRTDATHRPLLAVDPEGTYQRLASERRELYEEVADLIVDVEDFHTTGEEKPKHSISQHIVSWLETTASAAAASEAGS
jgi:shikimate kinase